MYFQPDPCLGSENELYGLLHVSRYFLFFFSSIIVVNTYSIPSSQTVSIKVQSVNYQSQPHGYKKNFSRFTDVNVLIFFKKTIVSLWKRWQKIENKTIVFSKRSILKKSSFRLQLLTTTLRTKCGVHLWNNIITLHHRVFL